MMEKILIQFFRWSTGMRDRPRRGCPGESELAAYADHKLAENEKERIDAHLADCEFCLGQVAFLVRAQGPEYSQTVPGPLLARARELASNATTLTPSVAWRWQALVATAACLVIVGVVTLRHPQRPVAPPPAPTTQAPPPRTPSQAPPPAERPSLVPRLVRKLPTGVLPPAVISPRDGAVVSRSKLEFRWAPVEGSLYYEARIVDAEGNVVWEQKTESTYLNLPGDADLKSGQRYFVWIRANLAGGGAVQSKAVRFTLAASH